MTIEESRKNPSTNSNPLKKLVIWSTIFLLFLWTPKEGNANSRKTSKEKAYTELAKNLSDWNEKESIDEIKEEYILSTLTLNTTDNTWNSISKTAKELNATIKKIDENKYSVYLKLTTKWWENWITVNVSTNFSKNTINYNVEDIMVDKYYNNWKPFTNINIEPDHILNLDDNNNAYDFRQRWNSISIKFNEQKTDKAIIEKIQNYKLNNIKQTNTIEELKVLNSPILWNEVYKDDIWKYRILYYVDNNQKIKVITNYYFDENGLVDIQKTNNNKKEFNISWISVDFNINNNGSFVISNESLNIIKEKVEEERNILKKSWNDSNILSNEDFPGLNKWENWYNNVNTKLYNIFDGIYWTNVNDKTTIYQKVIEWKPTLTTPEWTTIETQFISIENWNHYAFTWNKMYVINKQWENKQDLYPFYKWDKISNSINGAYSKLIENNKISYYDDKWNLIAEIPCSKDDKWKYKINENFSTDIDILDLYNYEQFTAIKEKIKTLAQNLWIVDADLRKYFKSILNKEGISLKRENCIKITDNDKNTYYCTLNKGFEINQDKALYKETKKSLEDLQKRLEIIEKCFNTKLQRKNWKVIQNFEWFIAGDYWIHKIVDQKDLEKFLLWNTDNINLKIIRWKNSNDYTIINYGIWWISILSDSKVYMHNQRYYFEIKNNIVRIIVKQENFRKFN